MTSFVNCKRKLPLSKQNYCLLDCGEGQRLTMAEIEKNVNIIVDFSVFRSKSKVFKHFHEKP